MFKNTISNTLSCNGQYYEQLMSGNGGKNYEHFLGGGGGNDTTVNDSKDISKKMELNTNINRSMVVKSVAKLVNTVVNEVAQSNSAEVENAVGASNTIALYGVECDVINISGISQSAEAQASTAAVIHQKIANSIETNITNSITKKITNSLPNDVADIQKKDNEMAKQFMNATPGLDPNAAKKLLAGTAKGGFGNDTTVNTSYKLEAELKKTLNLDESFKVDDNDEISNEIKNKISQKNLAKCSAVAAAANNVTLADIKCKTANISNIKQKAIAVSTLACAFDQEAVNKISTKVMNKLDKTFTKMYAAAKDDDSKKRIAAMGLAVGESIQNAAKPEGAKEPVKKPADDSASSEPEPKSKPVLKAPKLEAPKPSTADADTDTDTDTKPDTDSDTGSDTKSDDSKPVNAESNMVVFLGTPMTLQQKNYIIYGIIGFIVVIVLIIIMNQ
jgi:hypothetical protein